MLPSCGSWTGTICTLAGSFGTSSSSSNCARSRGSCSGTGARSPSSVSGLTFVVSALSRVRLARKTKAVMRCMAPAVAAMKAKKLGMSSVDPAGVNLDATRERKRGERPKIDMLVPDAMPIYWGKVLVEAKTMEKYLPMYELNQQLDNPSERVSTRTQWLDRSCRNIAPVCRRNSRRGGRCREASGRPPWQRGRSLENIRWRRRGNMTMYPSGRWLCPREQRKDIDRPSRCQAFSHRSRCSSACVLAYARAIVVSWG